MVHGLAGFQAGCRCTECVNIESVRVHQIARCEDQRWRDVNSEADRQWAERSGTDFVLPDATRMPWTPQDLAIARDRTLSIGQAAAKLQRTPAAVSAKRYKKPQLPEHGAATSSETERPANPIET